MQTYQKKVFTRECSHYHASSPRGYDKPIPVQAWRRYRYMQIPYRYIQVANTLEYRGAITGMHVNG